MRIIAISDTHGLHLATTLPEGDCLIHSGDCTNVGHEKETLQFLGWFNAQPHKYKILVAGNHDFYFEKTNPIELEHVLKGFPDIIYLNDSGVTIEDFKVWGSPVQPEFFNWAFNRERGDNIQRHWNLIPKDTDILVTHGPAYGFVDEAPDFNDRRRTVKVGCKNLRDTISVIKPKLHICGHIHYSYGHAYTADTLYVNASICNEAYSPINRPIIIDFIDKEPRIVHSFSTYENP